MTCLCKFMHLKENRHIDFLTISFDIVLSYIPRSILRLVTYKIKTIFIINKIFPSHQPCQLVKWQKNQHFKDHLCPCWMEWTQFLLARYGTSRAGVLSLLRPYGHICPFYWLVCCWVIDDNLFKIHADSLSILPPVTDLLLVWII
jgi:hypothetical protein